MQRSRNLYPHACVRASEPGHVRVDMHVCARSRTHVSVGLHLCRNLPASEPVGAVGCTHAWAITSKIPLHLWPCRRRHQFLHRHRFPPLLLPTPCRRTWPPVMSAHSLPTWTPGRPRTTAPRSHLRPLSSRSFRAGRSQVSQSDEKARVQVSLIHFLVCLRSMVVVRVVHKNSVMHCLQGDSQFSSCALLTTLVPHFR